MKPLLTLVGLLVLAAEPSARPTETYAVELVVKDETLRAAVEPELFGELRRQECFPRPEVSGGKRKTGSACHAFLPWNAETPTALAPTVRKATVTLERGQKLSTFRYRVQRFHPAPGGKWTAKGTAPWVKVPPSGQSATGPQLVTESQFAREVAFELVKRTFE